MNILIDENIPYAEEFFADIGKVIRFAGRELQPEQLIDVDVLLVRSITKVNAALLSQANKLKFVGTATIGEDHIDKSYLANKGINFSSAPGCNAVSVAEYVLSVFYVLAEKYHFNLLDKTVAIIGVGNTGKGVKSKLDALGVNTLLVDPPRANNEESQDFVELEFALKNADIITCHTPLIRNGENPTYHLINESNLSLLKDDVCLVNACRGEVIDNQALLEHIKHRQSNEQPAIKLALDVWENEPHPLLELIPFTDIATAHIAGYSLEGKSRGTEMLYQKVCDLWHFKKDKKLSDFLPKADVTHLTVENEIDVMAMKSMIHFVYDVRRDDALFRRLLSLNGFDWLRKNYPVRREWSSLTIVNQQQGKKVPQFCQLGFDILSH